MRSQPTQVVATSNYQLPRLAHRRRTVGVLPIVTMLALTVFLPQTSDAGEFAIKAGFERWNTTYVSWVPFSGVNIVDIEAMAKEGKWRIVDIEREKVWDLSSNDPDDYTFSGIMILNEGIFHSDWQILINEPDDIRNWCEKWDFRPFDIEHIIQNPPWIADKMIAICVRNSGNQYTPSWDFGHGSSFDHFSKATQDMASQRLIDIEISSAGSNPLDRWYSWISVSNKGDQYVPTMPGLWFNYTANEYFTAIEKGWRPIDVEVANVDTNTGHKDFIGIFVQTNSRSDFLPDHSESQLAGYATGLQRSLRAVDFDFQNPLMVTYLQTYE